MQENKTIFENANALHLKYPDKFEIPSPEQIKALKVGNFVKICASGERFWVKLTEINEGKYTAIVVNELLYTDIHGIKINDKIEFETKHIYSVY